MTKIKLILILVLMALLSVHSVVLAKEDKNDKEKDNHKREERSVVLPLFGTTSVQLLATSTSATTTDPVGTTTEPTATTTTPASPTSTPPLTNVTPAAPNAGGPFAPIINLFTPSQKNATSTAATSTPIGAMVKSGQVNNTLGDGFFASNYYGSSSFSPKATKSLMFLGLASGLVGLLLIMSKSLSARRLYP